jgi:tripartite-type tricarboxylate transporter receptor subunit TctC
LQRTRNAVGKIDRVRPIAMAEKKRSALMSDLPTMDDPACLIRCGELGRAVGPAGMDPKIVAKLHDEIVLILGTPDMQARIKTLGSI